MRDVSTLRLPQHRVPHHHRVYVLTLLMNRARYHLYMNPTKSQKAMRLKPGPRIMRGRRDDEVESTNPAVFKVSKRSKTRSSLLPMVSRGSSLCCFRKASCVETGLLALSAVNVVREERSVAARGKGANACATAANKAIPSQHNRLQRSILSVRLGNECARMVTTATKVFSSKPLQQYVISGIPSKILMPRRFHVEARSKGYEVICQSNESSPELRNGEARAGAIYFDNLDIQK
jgi:hypothetical protein